MKTVTPTSRFLMVEEDNVSVYVRIGEDMLDLIFSDDIGAHEYPIVNEMLPKLRDMFAEACRVTETD
jgi:hypothetical protein